MRIKLISLMLSLAVGGHAVAAPNANEAATARYFASLTGFEPKQAELTLFLSQMPKGGELHHHFDGAIYAEKFLEWIDRKAYCIDKTTFRIATSKPTGNCVAAADIIADNSLYRELLQRWSMKDYSNHVAIQPPPDQRFFETFPYFSPVSYAYLNEGLQHLKERAIADNIGYIETIFTMPPFMPDASFDGAILKPGADHNGLIAKLYAQLDHDAAFNGRIQDYVTTAEAAHANIDDANFTLRYQPFVLRLLPPSMVFSNMVSAFKAAAKSKLFVAVNIVGGENEHVSMRDYGLHMQMFKFLKAKYPDVKLALHAGELALGMVPPEGLRSHIEQSLAVGSLRVGHGTDIAHETNAVATMALMRARDIPVEINLTSNDVILGIKGSNHPVNLYRKHGVPIVLSTDDAGVARNDLASEYVRFARDYRPSYAEVKKISYNGVRYAFLPAADKQRLSAQLDARFAKFEASVAAQGPNAKTK